MNRDLIFISHAVLPRDNEFVLWLASRLQLLGYKVWCDLNDLKGGEHDYWGKVIEPQIRDRAAKFVVVVSKAGIVRQGVIDEYEFARAIAKEKDLTDFVIPLRIEDVPFTARISLNTYNVVNFVQNWQDGLNSLLKKFEEDKVPKNAVPELSSFLMKAIENNTNHIVKKRELYFSSWLNPTETPDKFYLFKYRSAQQAKSILTDYVKEYPISRHGSYLFSFHNTVNLVRKKNDGTLDLMMEDPVPSEVIEITISEIAQNQRTEFPTKNDCEYLLKRLFNWTLSFYMTKRGLKKYELANKKSCYYFPINYRPGDKVIINYHNRKKRKNLVGKFQDSFWHTALSFNFRVEPFFAYELKTHILFSDDGIKIWESSSKLHSARRRKGRQWFNEQWRDQLIAFLHYFARDDERVSIVLPVSNNSEIKLPVTTKAYYSDFGYRNPNSIERLDIINSKDEEIELNQGLNEEFE